MNIIEQQLLNDVATYIQSRLDVAYYFVGVTETVIPMVISVTTDELSIRVYLDETINETIEGIRIYDGVGNLMIERVQEFIKQGGKGVYQYFTIKLSEVILSGI